MISNSSVAELIQPYSPATVTNNQSLPQMTTISKTSAVSTVAGATWHLLANVQEG